MIYALVPILLVSLAGCGHRDVRPGPASPATPTHLGAGVVWAVNVGIDRQSIALEDLGISDRDAWLATRPRLVLDFVNTRLAFPIVAVAGDPGRVEVLGYFGQPPGRDDESIRLSVPTADPGSPGSSTVVFRAYLAQDAGTPPPLIRDRPHLAVAFQIHTDHCSPGQVCLPTRVQYRLHDGLTTIAEGALRPPDGQDAIMVGPVRIQLRVPEVTWPSPK